VAPKHVIRGLRPSNLAQTKLRDSFHTPLRHRQAVQAAAEAIERLDHDAHLINFSVVAQHAGVSRAWIYRQPEIRELITAYAPPAPRHPPPAAAHEPPSTPSGSGSTPPQRRSTGSRTENTALRDQLARLLSTHRAQLTDPTR